MRRAKARLLTPAELKRREKLKAAEATLKDTPLISRERQHEPVIFSRSSFNPTPRLRVGDVVELRPDFKSPKRDYAVIMVNDCRAYCIPFRTRDVTFKTVTGKAVNFVATEKGESISPNSDIEIRQRLGVEGLKKHFSSALKRFETEERNAVTTEAAGTAEKPPTDEPKRSKSASSKQSESKKGASSNKDSKKGDSKADSSSTEVSYKGRSERIKALVKAGKHKDFDAVYAVINKEYPMSSPSKVRKVYQAAVAELKEKK